MFNLDTLLESNGMYQTVYPSGQTFCWRLLSLKEYRMFSGLKATGMWLEPTLCIEVFKRCFLGDSDLITRSIPAGFLASIGKTILYLSGDCNQETLKNDLQLVRTLYAQDDVLEHMKRVIFTAFPSYTFEDVESWSRPELIQKFVVSEHILVVRGAGYTPLDLNDIKYDLEGEEDVSEIESRYQPIDFNGESKRLEKEIGFWEQQDMLDQQVTEKINRTQARKLDAARGR